MKLLVDPEIFFYGRCGMVRYYSRLFTELKRLGVEFDIPLKVSGSDMIQGSDEYLKKYISFLPFGRKRTSRYFERASKKAYFKKILEANYDLLFITSPVFEDNFLKFLPQGKQFVMVVHDTMQCVLGPDSFFDPAGHNGDKLAFLSRKTSRAICISNKVQEDLINLSAIDKSNTTVIHTGNLLDTQVESPVEQLPKDYILFVGDRSGRKNFRSFIYAIADFLKSKPNLFVVCTGNCSNWEKDLFVTLSIDKQIIFFNADDAQLVHLYKNARCLVYPSLYEGYGLPVLEAMSVGCPVVTSNVAAIPEVGGDAVEYVDPYCRKSIMEGIAKVLNHPEHHDQLRLKGLQQAQLFNLEAMVQSFKETLEKTLVSKS